LYYDFVQERKMLYSDMHVFFFFYSSALIGLAQTCSRKGELLLHLCALTERAKDATAQGSSHSGK